MSKLKEIYDRYKWLIDTLVTIVEVGLAIWGLTSSKSFESRFAFATLLICFIIVGGYGLLTGLTYKSLNREVKKQAEERKIENDSLQETINQLSECLEKTSLAGTEFARHCSSFQKSINKTLDNFRQKSMLNNDEYLTALEDMRKRSELTDSGNETAFENLCRSQIMEQRKHYAKQVFHTYNQYTTRIISETIAIIERYFKLMGYELKPSVTLKLLAESYCKERNDIPTDKIVFTAFRDKTSYEQGEREIGKEKYHILGNTDFATCLTKDSYIKNNVHRGSEDYNNEHEDFDKYYDCTLTVPVSCGTTPEKVIYGFYCCDTLNKNKYEVEIFDKTLANIMYASAVVLAFIIDESELYWDSLIEGSETFQEYIFTSICPTRGE
jgi:hypothetical protein